MSPTPLMDFIKQDLGPEYSRDEWVISFAVECLDLFGAPVSLDESISFEDELYHTFSTAALTITMKSMKECWEELRDQSPSEAAVEFSRTYWELRGEDLIPPFSYTQAKEL
tara:strand:+ start:514 stop:846 length:333 start_codon:yes stop_codon:yes gene_type:complete